MSTELNRVKQTYPEITPIPRGMEKYLWEHSKTAPLEKIILRILLYGKFEEIRKLYLLYPQKTSATADRYPEVKRGIHFWLQRWDDERNV